MKVSVRNATTPWFFAYRLDATFGSKERAAKPSAQDAPKIWGPKTPLPALDKQWLYTPVN